MISYKRDESAMHTAPAFVILLNAIAWILVLVGLIVLVTSSYKLVGVGILLAVSIWGIISDNYFNYYEGVTLSVDKNKIIYEYGLNRDVIPSANKRVKVTIKNVRKVKVHRKKALIYGDVLIDKPLMKPKSKNKYEVVINFGKDRDKLVSSLQEVVQK